MTQPRILVVDDSATYRAALSRILADLGHDHDTAANGREAVEAVRERRYDLVFMDIEMPELNGLEAAREILAMEGELPSIVAVTSNTKPGDRELAESAGMVGYIPKPADRSAISDAVRRFARGRPGAPVITAAGFEQLRDSVGDDGLHEVIEAFLGEVPQILDRMRDLIALGNAADAGKQAHGLKGSAAMLGADRLAEICARIELAGKAGNLDAVAADFPGAETEFAELRTELLARDRNA